jgi:16S rRNA (cytosine967-C5)-methyltransferase
VPPLVARANVQRTSRDALLEELRVRRPEVRACAHAPAALDLGHGGNPGLDPAFLEGRMTMQDEASQLVVELLAPQPGERILDLCAAPGTKATAIAERVGPEGSVLATDRHPRRLGLVRSSARRLGLGNLTWREQDGTGPLGELPGAPFDRILVDAPCSGLGTLRRHADARWRVQAEDPERLARIQHRLLERAVAVLRPGGTLVYSTCTVLPEENAAVVDAILSGGHGLHRVAPGASGEDREKLLLPFVDEAGDLRTLPHRHGMDGFYAARLRKED